MNLIEVAHPDGALTGADRARLAHDITDLITGSASGEARGAPEETMRRARRMIHVAFQPMLDWTSGDGPWREGDPPPLWITITAPEAWREEISRTLLGLVRRAVHRLDQRHGWQRDGGDVWVNVVGVPDGSIGLDGKAATADDVVAYMTEEFRANATTHRTDLPDGVVIDPMCGMQVRLGPKAITLEHDRGTVGFCAAACRAAYVRQHGLDVPA